METRSVIRLEHKSNGYGMYWNKNRDIRIGCDLKELIVRHNDIPLPYEDQYENPSYVFDYTDFCAFKTVEDFKKWFKKPELKKLVELGFIVVKLEISKCNVGVYQIMFKKEDIIKSTDITDKVFD